MVKETKKMDMLDYESGYSPLDVKAIDQFGGNSLLPAAWTREIPTFTDARALKSIYFTEDWIFILVDKIAMKLSPIPLKVFKETIVEGETVFEPSQGHPVQYILDNPNQFQTNYALQYSAITDLCVTGNALLYNAVVNRKLIHIPSETICLDIDGNGRLRNYLITGWDRQSMPMDDIRARIDPRNIIHIKKPNASSIHWGLSPLVPGQSPILFNRYSSEYLNNFFRKGAQPGMVVTTAEGTSKVQREELQNSLEKHNSGRNNQRRFMVLPNGSNAEIFPHTISDMQLLDHCKNNRETIINLLGVPKEIVSIQDTGSGLGSDQYKEAMKSFWTGTLMSLGNLIADTISLAYKPYLGDGFVIRKDYSQVPELQEDLKTKADLAIAMMSTMTLNEVRKKVWKIDAIAGGDITPARQNSQPQFGSNFPPQALDQITQSEQQSIQSLNPVESNPVDNTQAVDDLDYKSQNLMQFGKFIKEEGKSWWDKREGDALQKARDKEEPIKELFLDMIVEQYATAASLAKDMLITKTVEITNEEKLKKDISRAFQKQRNKYKEKYVKVLDAEVDLGYDSILNMPFGSTNQEEIAVMKDENYKNRRKDLFKRAEDSFDYLSKTTIDKVFSTIKSGIENNKSIADIGTDIKDVAKVSLSRADTIARTEVLTANSIGQAAAMKDAGKVLPDLYKVWVNANDERVRNNPGGLYPNADSDHWFVAGDPIPFDKKFSNGLSYPREAGGPASSVINCRCTLIAVSKKDLARLGFNKFS
jgi:HK97 family phage portal protein